MINLSESNELVFAGKYAFVCSDQSTLITVQNDTLCIATGDNESPSELQMFNLYGELKSEFILQAPNTNWNYVFYQQKYLANQSRNSSDLSKFHFEPIDSVSTYLIEDVNGVEYALNANGSNLERIQKTQNPLPATAVFNQVVVTDSLKQMVAQHSTLANPLTGVYLSKQDLSQVALMATDLSYADLSEADLHKQNLNGATAQNTCFDGANMSDCIANGLSFVNCTFVNTNMQYIKMSNAKMQGCNLNMAQFSAPQNPDNQYSNLQCCDFSQASMVGCLFNGSLVNSCIFNQANLTNADFSLAKGVEENLDFGGALLISANLSGHDLTKCLIDSNTNFMGAILNECDLSGHDLSKVVFVRAKMRKVNLDNTTIEGTQMAFADLSYASFKGGVSMIACNLSNSILQAAILTGAQLGAKKTLLSLLLTDSEVLDQAKVPEDLTQSLLEISQSAKVTVIQPGAYWSIDDQGTLYSLSANDSNILVQNYSPTSNAAILSNAYMPNANFDQANLYAVEMSGVHWYGANASAINADLGLANLSNSNLNGMEFNQSRMQGASFDFSKLIGTRFIKTSLDPSADLKPTSFAFASMQSTDFTATNLFSANLTNAAYAMEHGVPLFKLDSKFSQELNLKSISNDLQNDFTNSGYPLETCATVTVENPGWIIHNTNPDISDQTGYANFYLELIDDKNGLSFIHVSGITPLLILVLDEHGSQSQMEMAFGETKLTQQQLNDNTTCPSGMKYSMLGNHLTFRELMRAAVPPKPPKCANCW